MYPNTFIHPLFCEVDLVMSLILFNYRQKEYALQLLSFSDQHPTKEIILICLQKRDAYSQPGKLLENTLM